MSRSMKIYFFLYVFFLPLLLVAEDDILVRLATESSLSPLFVDSIKNEGSHFENSYLRELEKVIEFDFSHNGMTKVLPKTSERLNQAQKEGKINAYDQAVWKKLNAHFVFKWMVNGNKISSSIYDVHNNKIKIIDDLIFSGKLSEDRRLIHSIADAAHLALFGKKGICSAKIIYTVRTKKSEQNSEQWVTEVWESDYDGANAKQLTQEDCLCVTPTYVPSKMGYKASHFAYVSYRIGQPKIFIASLRDGVSKRLSYLRGNQLMPAINHQRTQLAFICDAAGNPDLFIQDFEPEKGLIGKPRQIFSAPKGTQGTPTFSPDGKKIAFVSNKDGTARIYVISIPNEGASINDIRPLLISKRNKDNTSPAWSVDGKKIAYSSSTQGIRQIWVYDFETGKETQLTQGPGHKENPTWASNSLHLMFNSATEKSSELYLINLNQPDATKISKGNGEKRFPCWEPAYQ